MTRDARAIVDLLGAEIARVGWSETARRSGVDRISLHRAFGPNRRALPSFTTVSLVAQAVGVKLEAHK